MPTVKPMLLALRIFASNRGNTKLQSSVFMRNAIEIPVIKTAGFDHQIVIEKAARNPPEISIWLAFGNPRKRIQLVKTLLASEIRVIVIGDVYPRCQSIKILLHGCPEYTASVDLS